MAPGKCITIRKNNQLTERGGTQAHFDDLGDLIAVEKLHNPENHCFERGAKESSGDAPFDPVQGRAGPMSGNAATYSGQQ